jgi:DNA-binding MarR family transcriptional regulator
MGRGPVGDRSGAGPKVSLDAWSPKAAPTHRILCIPRFWENRYIDLTNQNILYSTMSDIQTVLWALPRIHGVCRARDDPGAGMERVPLSDHQARILGYLDGTDPTMVTELAEHMRVTPSTMSLNLKRLRDAGFVTSQRDPDDRRVMNVRLTEVGVRARNATSALDPDRVDALLRRLGPEGRQRAMIGLRLLAEAADEAAGWSTER